VTGVFLQSGRKSSLLRVWGEGMVAYGVPVAADDGGACMELHFRCGGFSQVNYDQNRLMIRTVLDWSGLKGNERILDLYCGNGNFSLPLSRSCAEVVGMEDYRDSVEDAVFNGDMNGIRNARFMARDTASGLRELIDAGESFDQVLLDPPRTGAREAVHLIPALGPEKIIYVSCDPSTLARDLSILYGKGYRVAASRAIDMFPQTYHIESVTLLTKV
jgi:23S rRNA (uracil1939-C5)-methyltransferase